MRTKPRHAPEAPRSAPVATPRAARAALSGLCVAAVAGWLAAAAAFPNIVWPDEIFQTLEPAHRLAFGYGIITWEFREGARSWVFPGLLAGPMAVGGAFGALAHVWAARLALAIAALVPVVVVFRWVYRRDGVFAAAVAGAACAGWFELVFFSTKALNEVVGAHALLGALFLASGERPATSRLRLAGVALGLAVVLRLHLAPAAAVAAVAICRRSPDRWRGMLGGAVAVAAFAGMVDVVTWSAPFRSFWVNFRFNLLEGKSAKFGVLPWDAYVTMFARNWGWGAIPVVALAVLAARRQPAVAACAVVTLISHSAIAHKEYRFVYPVVLFTVVLGALGLVELARAAAQRLRVASPVPAAVSTAAWLAVSAWAGTRFASDGSFGFTRPGESMWTQGAAGVQAMARLGADPAVCGVALAGVHWAWTGGYTYLHRDVPVYGADDRLHFARLARAVNAVLVTPENLRFLEGFTPDFCWSDLCIARRPGGCEPVNEITINAQLARSGA